MSVIIIQVPALKNRADDIPLLVNYFLNQTSEEQGKKMPEISADALAALQDLSWSGNVRELRNVVERLVILSGDTIEIADVKKYV